MEPVLEPRSLPRYDDSPVILRGTLKVLAVLSELDDLRCRSDRQDDLTTDLPLLLSRDNSHQRRPVLVLLKTDGILSAAVLFAERCVLGRGIGLLRAGDQAGDGAVIAPTADRRPALLAAVGALLRQWRCHTVAVTLSGVSPNETPVLPSKGLHTETATRTVRRYLPLSHTLDETLHARFTPKKRKNLLYYYRTLWKTHDVEFIPALNPLDIPRALLELAQHSWPNRSPREIGLHCDFLRRHHPESFCMGIRLRSGPWLSLVTGWRIGGVTHMPWQLNHDGYKDASLMQVMRVCLIEHECALGQTALSWVGGTVAFKTACEPEFCLDLLQARRSLRGSLLRLVIAPIMFRRDAASFTGGSLMLLLPPRTRALISALDPLTTEVPMRRSDPAASPTRVTTTQTPPPATRSSAAARRGPT